MIRDLTEEDFFKPDRKSGKKERRLASLKDRSKYKKTDLHKHVQRQVQSHETKIAKHELIRGRILSIKSQGIIVDVDGELFTCSLRGLLKKEKGQNKNLVTVGDFVLLKKTGPQEGYISKIEPRQSVLSRADNLSRRKKQLIASNIDQVIITTSVVSPALKPFLVDRYIIATQKGGMEAVIVINKIDLLSGSTPEILQEKEQYEAFVAAYKGAGIPLIPISAKTQEGIDALKEIMKNKASVFSGQSGVGKSSLINAVAGLDLPIGDVVEKTGKGAHTTTTANLMPLPFGGWCIDTPGIKSFGMWEVNEDEIAAYFPEFQEYASYCKYPDCSHTDEQDCAVISAVQKGELSLLRYQSYHYLMESLSQVHRRR